MTPHLVKWDEQFAGRGLRIIDIDNGQMDSLPDLREHVRSEGITYPVLHDTNGEVCARYRVSGYPTAYLIGRNGKVRWKGHPGNAPEHERQIKLALDE